MYEVEKSPPLVQLSFLLLLACWPLLPCLLLVVFLSCLQWQALPLLMVFLTVAGVLDVGGVHIVFGVPASCWRLGWSCNYDPS